MSKKHFDALAAALLASKPATSGCFASMAELERWEKTVQNVIAGIDGVCPNFNPARFKRACGLETR